MDRSCPGSVSPSFGPFAGTRCHSIERGLVAGDGQARAVAAAAVGGAAAGSGVAVAN